MEPQAELVLMQGPVAQQQQQVSHSQQGQHPRRRTAWSAPPQWQRWVQCWWLWARELWILAGCQACCGGSLLLNVLPVQCMRCT